MPSTFSFVAQYYIFMTSMVAFGYASWRRARTDPGPGVGPGGMAALPRGGPDLRGARALAFVPLLLIAFLLIDGHLGVSSGESSRPSGGLASSSASSVQAPRHRLRPGHECAQKLHFVFITASGGLGHLFLGTGTGSDTNAARYCQGPSSRRRLAGDYLAK